MKKVSRGKEIRQKEKENRKRKKLPYDPFLLERIQPQGGITFKDDRYVHSGNGYETCIHIYEFPKKLDDFWLSKVCNINNTIVTVDISTDNVMEVQKNINRSMKEQHQRYLGATDFKNGMMPGNGIRKWNGSMMRSQPWAR